MKSTVALLAACVAFATAASAAAPKAGRPMRHLGDIKVGRAIGPLTLTATRARKDKGEAVGEVVEFKDVHGGAASLVAELYATIGAGRIDPDSDEAQVLLTSYTGGAHCCVHIQLLDRIGGAWRKVDVGTFDGEPFETFPTDVDGDGVADIVRYDDRFAYVFGCYACSWMPPRIFNVRSGKTLDVSAEPRYRALFEKDYRGAKAECLKHSNPGCAGLVADGVRLGRADEAWKIALANIDRKDDWTLPGCKVKAGRDGGCPKGKDYTAADFRPALTRFLAQNGYGAAPR
jgi:hypothetical protein